MNTAYKWYSHNNNIIQFYSGDLSKTNRFPVDYVEETVGRVCDYAVIVTDNYEQKVHV